MRDEAPERECELRRSEGAAGANHERFRGAIADELPRLSEERSANSEQLGYLVAQVSYEHEFTLRRPNNPVDYHSLDLLSPDNYFRVTIY